MLEIVRMFGNMFRSFSIMLDNIILNVAGISVSYLDLLIGFICLGMIINFFWKGAHE